MKENEKKKWFLLQNFACVVHHVREKHNQKNREKRRKKEAKKIPQRNPPKHTHNRSPITTTPRKSRKNTTKNGKEEENR